MDTDAPPPAPPTPMLEADAETLAKRIRDAEKLYLSFEEAAQRLGLIMLRPDQT